MTSMTPQTNAPTGGAKARPAKSNKSAQGGDPSPVFARSTKKSAKAAPKKAATKKAAPKKAAGKKAAPKKSVGSNKTQNRTASRHKVTAKE